MKNKSLIIIVASAALMILIFVFGTQIYRGHETEKMTFMAEENFKLFVPDHAMRKGNPEAKVFVVEFFDPECESCREFHPFMYDIMSEFDGKIQLVMRYAPFHGNSLFAVAILEAARKQDKYWEALEILYQHQPEWGNHHHPRPELVWNYLPRLGIDIERLKKDMRDPEIQKIIQQDQKDGAVLEVRQTPSFFVNGKPLVNFGPDQLKQLIENELKEVGHP